MNRITVSAVAFQAEDGRWFAQGVDYDILASADTLNSLPRAFERALAANLCVNTELGRDGLQGIPAAPAHYREMFDAAASSWSYEERLPRGARKQAPVDKIALRLTEAA